MHPEVIGNSSRVTGIGIEEMTMEEEIAEAVRPGMNAEIAMRLGMNAVIAGKIVTGLGRETTMTGEGVTVTNR